MDTALPFFKLESESKQFVFLHKNELTCLYKNIKEKNKTACAAR